ncbi:M28 family peptidase [Mucilaginibacter auburnensis]|uniref:Peptidase M28-like protein n=1 Tax=Mucilaginibacter auburnensis TaxID=1457233 RepID=A0A2H9VQV8_9SPHI|nr:M28 family peptidase [Mucilaginibacter auburnensis]PJJ83227.1 peptidase M28-like protein [Mucilaginibacter auburnensis]
MKKTLIMLVVAGFTTGACAQQNPTALKYSKIVSAELAKKHLSIIASDEFEGRETGKPGAEKAANYIANEFKVLGLKPAVNGSYFLDVPIVEPSFTVNALTANGKTYTIGTDFSATGGVGTKTVTSSDIVFIGYGIGADTYNDLKGTDITGKVVLYINTGEPVNNGVFKVTGTDKTSNWSTDRSRRIQFIQSKKPALILAVNPAGGAVRRSNGSRMVLKKENTDVPVYTITPAMANALLQPTNKTIAQLKTDIDQSGTPQTQTIKADFSTIYTGTEKPVKAVDVVGILPGRDAKLKDEYLVVSAHYDHIGMLPEGTKGDRIYNGADDDGSGTTAMLEIARAFSAAKKAGKGPRRSILFLGNVGEEKGLLGSEYYSEHPVVPMASTIADLNIDMIGRVGEEYVGKADSANTVYVIGSSMLSSDLHKVGESANNTYTKLKLDYKYDDPNDPNRFYYRSDHYNFAKFGVPIIFYFNGVHADYHGLGDEISKINFPLLAKRAQLVYFTAWDLANADKRPAVDGKNTR